VHFAEFFLGGNRDVIGTSEPVGPAAFTRRTANEVAAIDLTRGSEFDAPPGPFGGAEEIAIAPDEQSPQVRGSKASRWKAMNATPRCFDRNKLLVCRYHAASDCSLYAPVKLARTRLVNALTY